MSAAPDPDAVYVSPLVSRYAGQAMARRFSARRRAKTWRELWVALAEEEAALGLPISEAQLGELRARTGDADLARVAELERELRHDVMAHVHHYGEQCPGARGIIHLGATSCYVTDNADLLLMREGLGELAGLVRQLVRALAHVARRERDTACLSFTHLQPAQLTTVGKRACLWIQDLVFDHAEITRWERELPFLGVKGTTGTQASFLALLDGDHELVEELDRRVARRLGFERLLPISEQTYPRKLDHAVLATLSGLAASISKLSHDLRLLQARGEMREPFGARQVGSSAMPYKRNPMRAERLSSLARYLISSAQNAPWTAAVQWLERTLDDSANRRLVIPECFLAADALCRLACNVAAGLEVDRRATRRGVARELPFMATENLLMAAVRAGGDRQQLHERIRVHALASREAADATGGPPDILQRMAADDAFAAVGAQALRPLDPLDFTGRASQQVDRFLQDAVDPLLQREDDDALPPPDEPRV